MMRRAVVSDLDPMKKFIILRPQEYCGIPPLATVDLPKARNNVQHPHVSPKLMKKSRRTIRRKNPLFSIDSRDYENVDDKSKVETMTKKRCGRKNKTTAAGLDLPKLPSRPKTPPFSIANKRALPSQFVPESCSTGARDMRCSLLIKSTLQKCQGASTHSSSRHVGLQSPRDVRAPHQTDFLASRDYRTAAYRKIDFNNCTVISTEIPLTSTFTIDSDDEFDMFKPPYFRSVPINIFEPVTIKHEKIDDDNEDTIFNEDVLINSNSTSVSTVTKYENDWHLDQNKLNISQLYNPGLCVNQHPKTEKDLDERVETLRNINSLSSIALGSDPAPDPVEIGKEIIPKKEVTFDAKRDNIDNSRTEKNSSEVMEANETPIAGEANETPIAGEANETPIIGEANGTPIAGEANETPIAGKANETSIAGESNETLISCEATETAIAGEANKKTSNIHHVDIKKAQTPQDKLQKTLLENLDLQIKLLEDIVYGTASKATSTETYDSSKNIENHTNVSEAVETNASQVEPTSDCCSTTSHVQIPNNDITQSEIGDDMVMNSQLSSSGAPLESVAQKEDLKIANADSSVKSGDIIVSTSVISEVEENQETLANIPLQLSNDDIKSEEIIEILCNDPFANTFGKPDEVIISETVESDNKEHVEELQYYDSWDGEVIQDIVSQPLASLSEKTDEENVSQSRSPVQCILDICSEEVQPESQEKEEQTDQTMKNNVPIEMIESTIHERICKIIKEETDKIELSTDKLCSALNYDEKVQVIDIIGKGAKKKIVTLQRIISFFNDIIDQNMCKSSTRAISEIGSVETLIDSTLNLYTIRQKYKIIKNKHKKTKSLRCQKIKKLLSRGLYKLNKLSRKNDPEQADISVLSDDECLKTLKQLIEEAEKLSQNNPTTSQMKNNSEKEGNIVEDPQDEESGNADVSDINNERTVNIDIDNDKIEDLSQCSMPHDYHCITEKQIIEEFSSEQPIDSYSHVERGFFNFEDDKIGDPTQDHNITHFNHTSTAEEQTTEELDMSKEFSNLDHAEIEKAGQQYMEPLIFSEIEDIIGIPPKISGSESNENDSSSASNTIGNDNSMYEEPHSVIKKLESLKTYSRKGLNHIEKLPDEISKSKQILVKLDVSLIEPNSKPEYIISAISDVTETTVTKSSGEERSILKIEPTMVRTSRRSKKVEKIDEPTKPVRTSRRLKKEKIEDAIYNFDDPEWPIRRISKRIKKQPEFYGCPCGIEKQFPKRQKQTKD